MVSSAKHNIFKLLQLSEDFVKRDVKKAGEEGDWKKKTQYRVGWKRLADEAVKRFRHHLTPDKGKKRKREINIIYVY